MPINFYIDQFFPKPFFNPGVGTADDYIYLLIMPAVLDTDSSKFPNLVQYLTGPPPAGGYSFNYVGNDKGFRDQLTSGTPMSPVPLPPGTAISLKISGQTIATTSAGYQFAKNDDRIEWIYRNMSFVELDPSKYFDYLTDVQHTALNNFVVNILFNVLAGRHADGSKTDAASPATPAEKNVTNIKDWVAVDIYDKVNTYFTLTNKQTPVKPDFLKALSQQYTAKFNFDVHDAQNAGLVPPPLRFDKDKLKKLAADTPTAINDLLGSDMRYLKTLWDSFTEGYKSFNLTDPLSAPVKLANQVRLYYGGGERLRIPSIPAGSEGLYMPVIDDVNPDAMDDTWTVSNNYALAGQVIAIPGAVFAAPHWAADFELQINGVSVFKLTDPEPDPYNRDFIDMLSLAATKLMVNYHSGDFSQAFSTLTHSDDLPQKAIGKAQYNPANSILGKDSEAGVVLTEAVTGKQLQMLSVPKHLLDELEADAGVSYVAPALAPADKLIYYNLQRQYLSTAELFKNGTYAPGSYKAVSSPGIIPALSVQVQLKQVILPVAPLAQGPVFKLSCSTSGLHDTDLNNLRQIFNTAGTGYNLLDLSLVYKVTEPASSSKELLRFIKLDSAAWLNPTPVTGDLIKLYTSQDLTPLFPQASAPAASGDGERTVAVDLLVLSPLIAVPAGLPAPPPENYLFNRFINSLSDSSFFMALENSYKFKFNQSVNSFAALVQLDLKVSAGLAADASPAAVIFRNHYANFKKLRVDLASSDGNTLLNVNNADAVLPAFSKGGAAPGVVSTLLYELTHSFSNQAGTDPDVEENNRYILYKNGGSNYGLQGYIENQYAFRRKEISSPFLSIGYSQPLINAAEMVIQREKDSGDNDSLIPDVYALLNFEVSKDRQLVISLDPNCIAQMIKGYTDGTETKIKGNKPFRELYEAFFDAYNNACSLIVECWNFDNSVHIIDADMAAHPEESGRWPNVLNNLVPAGSVVFQIDAQIKNLFSWAAGMASFQDFKQKIILQAPVNPVFVQLPADFLNKVASADVIRTGLKIDRDSEKTVAALFSGGNLSQPPKIQDFDLVPFVFSDKNGDPLPGSDLTNTPKAVENLLKYIYPYKNDHNRLFSSLAYLYSSQYNTLRTSTDRAVSKNIKELLGEMAKFCFILRDLPPGQHKQTADVQLYYVPYAFLPLLANPKIGSQQATTDFTEYLVKVISWMCYPEEFKGLILDYINIDTSALNDPNLILALKNGARDVLQRTVASLMSSLIDIVDNRDDIVRSGRATKELTEIIAITTAITKTPSALQAALTSALINNPDLFITAKGFGTGLFSSRSASGDVGSVGKMNDIYSIQLIKDIVNVFRESIAAAARSKEMVAPAATPKTYDISMLNFHNFLKLDSGWERYFIEVLDDELYEDQFKISETVCDNPIPLAAGNAIPQNASQGRTAADLLENMNMFNPAVMPPPVPRNVNILTRHYNPDWKLPTAKELIQYYLLPSRKAPSIPIQALKVSYKDATGNYKVVSPMVIKNFSGDPGEWQNILNTQTTLYVSLDKKDGDKKAFNWDKVTFYNNQQWPVPPAGSNVYPNDNNWKRLDAFVNNYFFLLDGDEEGALVNDMIEIGVDRITNFSIAETSGSPAAIAGKLPDTPLFAQYLANFDYFSHKQEYINNGIVRPGPVTISNAQQVTDNLNLLSDAFKALLQPSNENQNDADDLNTFRFNPSGTNILFSPATGTALGNVLFTEVYLQDDTENPDVKNRKFLIRVAVLTDAWSYFRCRMRIKRNWRVLQNIPGYETPVNDLNPKFIMTSAYSDWADFGIQTLSYNYLDMPQINEPLLKYLPVDEGVLTIDDYINNPGARNIPGLISNTISQLKNKVDQRFLGGAYKRVFEVLVYDRKGNNLLAQYSPGKPNTEILAINKAYAEKNEWVIISREQVQESRKPGAAEIGLDLVANPLSASLKGYAPFIQITWFSDIDGNVPVFSINWQLKFSNFN